MATSREPRAEPAPSSSSGSSGERAPAAQTEPSPRTAAASSSSAAVRTASGASARVRVARPAVSVAGPRRAVESDTRQVRISWAPVYYPTLLTFGGWGYSSSYGRGGFGSSYGRGGYGYNPYGNNPYSYRNGYPFGYPMYWSSPYADDSYDEGNTGDNRSVAVGSIRFRVNPSNARIYIDGALVGTVKQFEGLTGHLRLGEGSHAYELRADGYVPHTGVLTVMMGQTRTERVNLKRQ